MFFISRLIKISVFGFHINFEIVINLFLAISCLIVSFANVRSILEVEVLDIWFKIFSAVGLFLLTFFMWGYFKYLIFHYIIVLFQFSDDA